MSECELVVLVSSVACAISKCCSTDDLSILSAVFTQLGDTLATIITKRELSEKNANSKIINMNDESNMAICKKDED
jgi:dolichol kinase